MKYYNDRLSQDPPFQIGHKVWIYNPKKPKGLTKKLLCFWHGPFRLIEQTSPVNFKVQPLDNRCKPFIVHVNRLKQYYDPEQRPTEPPAELDSDALDLPLSYHDQSLPENDLPSSQINDLDSPDTDAASDLDIQGPNAPPDLDPEEDAPPSQETPDDTFQVERIVKHRQKKGKNEYLIKWLGFPKSQNTWEPEEHLHPTLIQNFHNANPTINLIQLSKPTKPHSDFWFYQLILSLLFIPYYSYTLKTLPSLYLGPLYDCSHVYPQGLFSYPTIRTCSHSMHDHNQSVQTQKSEVYKYQPTATKFKIYHCVAQEFQLKCYKNVVFHVSKHEVISSIPHYTLWTLN